jgi:ribosomal protein S18 acetylase RimI-like enzyme
MPETRKVTDTAEKSSICNDILRALPSWFGVEASIIDYVNQVQVLPFYASFDYGKAIGFVALKPHNPFTSEIYVMGILKEYHRQGIGRGLVDCCERYSCDNNVEYLTVKTLDESRKSNSYEKTRLFYLSMGFKPLEVFPTLWDKDNPCLLMVKYIAK